MAIETEGIKMAFTIREGGAGFMAKIKGGKGEKGESKKHEKM